MSDHILQISVGPNGLAESKNPPICDNCNSQIPFKEDGAQEGEIYFLINCLILDQGREGLFFHSVQCDACVSRYFSKLPVVDESKEIREVKLTVRAELSQNPIIAFIDGLSRISK